MVHFEAAEAFGPKTMARATFLLIPILFKVAHTTGLCMDLHWLSDSLVAAIVYPMLAM
jgi:hypothetical protein